MCLYLCKISIRHDDDDDDDVLWSWKGKNRATKMDIMYIISESNKLWKTLLHTSKSLFKYYALYSRRCIGMEESGMLTSTYTHVMIIKREMVKIKVLFTCLLFLHNVSLCLI